MYPSKDLNIIKELVPIIPKTFEVIFRESGSNIKDKNITVIKVREDEKVSDIIQKYKEKNSDFDENLKFIFNAKSLNTFLTATEAGLSNNSNIFVIRMKL